MTTLEKVCEIILKIKKNTPAASLKPETRFVDDLKFDSLDLTELLVLAEGAFSIEIPLEDSSKLTTIAAAAEYVDKRLAK